MKKPKLIILNSQQIKCAKTRSINKVISLLLSYNSRCVCVCVHTPTVSHTHAPTHSTQSPPYNFFIFNSIYFFSIIYFRISCKNPQINSIYKNHFVILKIIKIFLKFVVIYSIIFKIDEILFISCTIFSNA